MKLAQDEDVIINFREEQLKPILLEDDRRLELATLFTDVYKKHMHEHVALREAYCQQALLPEILRDIRHDHLFAGGVFYNLMACIGLEYYCNDKVEALIADDTPRASRSDEDNWLLETIGFSSSGFCFDYQTLGEMRDAHEAGSDEYVRIDGMINFWLKESTRTKYNEMLPKSITDALGTTSAFDVRFAVGYPRLATFSMDYDLLLTKGIPGLEQKIQENLDASTENGEDEKVSVYQAMLISLDTVKDLCRIYIEKAEKSLETETNEKRMGELEKMRDSLAAAINHKPESLHQAIQLFWIYMVTTRTRNFSRMDVYLGDFYANDIDSGVETEESAQELLNNLWLMISDLNYFGLGLVPNGRIFIGGKGRRNEVNANRFAMAAMEASDQVREVVPQLTLRFHEGQDPALFEKAVDIIGKGTVHPGLYNDDVHIPSVMETYHVSESEAAKYIPQGCGELNLDGCTIGSPNSILNLVHGLELVLHNGYNHVINDQRGLAQGEPESFDTFDKLLDAYYKQLDFIYDVLAHRHAIEHEAMAKESGFVLHSILTHDCIGRGETLYNGTRYKGGIIETFGMTNLADSLYAIRTLVYEDQKYTLRDVVTMLDTNFEGYEQERMEFLRMPKYGNDHHGVDELHREIANKLNFLAYDKAGKYDLDFFLNCNLNPGGAIYGDNTCATADGRLEGVSFALGNCPTAGMDASGMTALLNSMARPVEKHAGCVHNLKLSKDLFSEENRPKLMMLLKAYFANGGMQLMMTALNKDDLKNAMEKPEEYRELMVRVAGWTGHFVEQESYLQKEIYERTFYS